MKIKIEQLLIWLGICGLSPYLLIAYLGAGTPHFFMEFFRGGNVGGMIAGLLFVFGFIGICMYFKNIYKGQRYWWKQRLIAMLAFLLSTVMVGSFF